MQACYTQSRPWHSEKLHSNFICINKSKDKLCIHDAYLKIVGLSIHPFHKTKACPV